MLGYVRPYTPELRLREYQYYRGVYCGLCRAMGRCTGQCSRLTLSYDLVFLALTRLALTGGNPTSQREGVRAIHFEKRRCLAHPLRPRLSLEAGAATDHAACVSAVLGYYKLLDDREDETGAKRLLSWVLLPFFHGMSRRATRHIPELFGLIEPHMKRLSDLEKCDLASADEPADAFGLALAALFSQGLPSDTARIAHHIGYRVGRWLYFVDAVDDYEQDVRKGRPNALYRLYGEPDLSEQHREDLSAAMGNELRLATQALDLVSVDEQTCGKELMPLLYHMLKVALPQVAHSVLYPTSDKKRTINKKASALDDGSL